MSNQNELSDADKKALAADLNAKNKATKEACSKERERSQT